MTERAEQLAKKFLRREWEKLTERERRVIQSFVDRKHVSRNLSKAYDDDRTFGERVADRVASFGGSWTFIFIFGATLISWVVINSILLMSRAFARIPTFFSTCSCR